MDTNRCVICRKTNHIPDGHMVLVATFAQQYQAKNTVAAIERAHIVPVWFCIFSQEEILEKAFDNSQTLVIQLHGIKDIIKLQSLYIESMCNDNNSLTVDILSTKNSCDTFLQKLHN